MGWHTVMGSGITRKRLAAVVVGAAGVIALSLGAATAAYAEPVDLPDPILVVGNATDCDDVDPEGDEDLLTSGGGPNNATGPAGSGTIVDGDELDVSIEAGFSVTAIVVKGSNEYNLYLFDPAVAGPADFEGLVAPIAGGSGDPANISHWFVCGEKTTTTTPPPTTTTMTTTTTTPGLPTTGASLGGLIAAGVALVAGGATLLFLRRRREATDTGAES